MGENKKSFFFYLFLVDLIIATQVAVISVFSKKLIALDATWVSQIFALSFALAFLVFIFFSGLLKNALLAKSVIQTGLVFIVLGSLINFLSSDVNLFIFGRTVCGLGAGMILVGQLGIIWHEDFEKMKKFSLAIVISFVLGLAGGPSLVKLLSGPALSEAKIVFLLGTIFPVLAMFEKITEIVETVLENSVRFFAILFKAFFNTTGDDVVTGSKKIGKTVVGRVIYTILEYWVAIACAGMIGFMKYYNWPFLQIFFAVWVIDFVLAIIVLVASEKSGQDITLGESFRRAANVVHSKSRIVGYFTFVLLIANAIIWEGPVQIVIIFKKEFGSETNKIVALIFLTILQAAFWTYIYSLGYDSLSELIKHYF